MGWEDTLKGVPREIYDIWADYLHTRGYQIRYIVDKLPGSLPENVSIVILSTMRGMPDRGRSILCLRAQPGIAGLCPEQPLSGKAGRSPSKSDRSAIAPGRALEGTPHSRIAAPLRASYRCHCPG